MEHLGTKTTLIEFFKVKYQGFNALLLMIFKLLNLADFLEDLLPPHFDPIGLATISFYAVSTMEKAGSSIGKEQQLWVIH